MSIIVVACQDLGAGNDPENTLWLGGLKIKGSGVQLPLLVVCRSVFSIQYCLGPPSHNGAWFTDPRLDQ